MLNETYNLAMYLMDRLMENDPEPDSPEDKFIEILADAIMKHEAKTIQDEIAEIKSWRNSPSATDATPEEVECQLSRLEMLEDWQTIFFSDKAKDSVAGTKR